MWVWPITQGICGRWALKTRTRLRKGIQRIWVRHQQYPQMSISCTIQVHVLFTLGLLHPVTASLGFWLVIISGTLKTGKFVRQITNPTAAVQPKAFTDIYHLSPPHCQVVLLPICMVCRVGCLRLISEEPELLITIPLSGSACWIFPCTVKIRHGRTKMVDYPNAKYISSACTPYTAAALLPSDNQSQFLCRR